MLKRVRVLRKIAIRCSWAFCLETNINEDCQIERTKKTCYS